jgi:hypothetical protein
VSETWFVSSLGGGLSLEKDGFGWVSRFDRHGGLLAARWIENLDAPTGMASIGDSLYVADRGRVVEIDVPSAQIRREIVLAGAEFVNDVAAAPNGDIYVSDTATNRIYKITDGAVEVWLQSVALQGPNGLWVDGDRLVVATWGPMTDIETFATKHPGTLLTVDLGTKQIYPVGPGEPIANFDGVIAVDGYYLATDWTGGRLLKIDKHGDVRVILSGFSQLADLGYSPLDRVIALPIMSENRLILFNLGNLVD